MVSRDGVPFFDANTSQTTVARLIADSTEDLMVTLLYTEGFCGLFTPLDRVLGNLSTLIFVTFHQVDIRHFEWNELVTSDNVIFQCNPFLPCCHKELSTNFGNSAGTLSISVSLKFASFSQPPSLIELDIKSSHPLHVFHVSQLTYTHRIS